MNLSKLIFNTIDRCIFKISILDSKKNYFLKIIGASTNAQLLQSIRSRKIMPQYFGKLQTIEQPWTLIEAVQRLEKSDRSVDLICGKSLIRVSVLAANLIRVRFAPTGEFLPRRSWAAARKDGDWDKSNFEVQETPETIEIQTAQMKVTIERTQGRLQCSDRNGTAFACDAEAGMGWRSGSVAGWKMIEPDEHFYGFGERTGLLDQRSEIKTNWTVDCIDYNSLTDEMYPAIPFFMALRPNLCYGIFLNSTYWSSFDIGVAKPGVWQMETRSMELDYYIIYGTEPSQVLQTYAELTGKMPLPPVGLWVTTSLVGDMIPKT